MDHASQSPSPTVDTAPPAVDVERLSVAMGDLTLLSPVNLTVARGRSLVVDGPNGSGKTTLLSVLTGLLPPTHGSVRVLGMRPDDRNRRFRAGVTGLIGRAPISRELTVVEHLEAIAMSWSLPDPQITARHQLEELEIDFLADRFPHELSSGQTQLMQLGMVLIRPADLLVLDEPEQRLDTALVEMLISLLSERTRAGTTLILASHSPRVIDRLGDQHLHLEPTGAGRLS